MAMDPNKTAIERAFELARTGLYFEIGEIKNRLMGEGYFTDSITGPTLRAQLRSLMKSGQKTRWNVSSHMSSASTRTLKRSPELAELLTDQILVFYFWVF